MTDDPRTRWAEHLSVPPDATPEGAAAAFLRALPGEDFVPPAERVAGANALAGANAPVGRDPGVEQMLRDETEALVARFWALPPTDRQAAWADLLRRGAPEPRLRGLEAGLGVAAGPLADPDADELAGLFRALFVLPPRERAVRRNAWIAEHALDAFRWRAALAVLVREEPGVPALDARFCEVLGPDFDLAAFSAGVTVSPGTGLQRSEDIDTVVVTARGRARRPQHERADDPSEFDPAADRRRAKLILLGGPLGIILLVAVFSVVIWARNSARDRPAPVPPAGPSIHRRDFNPVEVAGFERYEWNTNQRRNAAKPPGYDDWLRAGRPRGTPYAIPPR